MKIVIADYSHEQGLGDSGGVRKLLSLAGALRRLGHTVWLLFPDTVAASGEGLVRYHVAGRGRWRAPSAYAAMAIALWRLGRAARPDIVYQRRSPTLLPALLAKAWGARFFYEVNGDPRGERGGRAAPLKTALVSLADAANCRLADRVIVLTPGLADIATVRYGVPPSRVRIVPSGADLEAVKPLDRGRCRGLLGLSGSEKVVAFLGVLYEHQGVQTLIQAAPLLLRRVPRARVMVLGDGPYRTRLEDAAKRAGAAVSFEGRIPYERVPVYLGACDVCVAPFTALRGETSPLKLFDYMAAGRPAVVSDIPSVRDLIRASGSMIPVPPDEPEPLAAALCDLLADPGRCEALGRRGRGYAERHHGWEALARRILE